MAWRFQAREPQQPPDGAWRVWYIRGGRGSGKTWTGSHQLAEWIQQHPGNQWAVVAPTFGDGRDVCVEGESGLLRALGLPRTFKGWNRSMGELFVPGGGVVFVDGADDGALRIQGKNLAGLWADEIGLWRDWRTAWEESIAFAVRIDPARVVATGTPKRGHPLVLRLHNDPTIPKTLLRTLDNADNLSSAALDDLLRRYEGTTLGRQELEGEVLTEVPGALWRPDIIRIGEAALRHIDGELQPDYQRIVVAIDPAVTYGPDSDETGIVAGGLGVDGDGYVLDDQSGRFAPLEWARRAIALHDHLKADAIVAEVNQGGDMVEQVLRSAGFLGHLVKVTASRGKRVRAEPIAAFYEQGRIKHARTFPELEDQLCTFTPESVVSPDRLDALVWAMTELMLEPSYSGDRFSMIA